MTELKVFIREEESDTEQLTYSRKLDIYLSCLKEAFENDTKINREAKITDDERGILNILAVKLGISSEDQAALEHVVEPIPKNGVQEALNSLREFGLLFISRKRHTVYVPDEIVSLLNRIQGKDLANKYLLRILRTMSEAELSTILKNHNRRIRGIERREKISTILHMGLTGKQILMEDLYPIDTSQNERKDRLKALINDLNLYLDKLGSTVEERVNLIISSFHH